MLGGVVRQLCYYGGCLACLVASKVNRMPLLAASLLGFVWGHNVQGAASGRPPSQVFGVDIHPAARIGWGVMMDHATGEPPPPPAPPPPPPTTDRTLRWLGGHDGSCHG